MSWQQGHPPAAGDTCAAPPDNQYQSVPGVTAGEDAGNSRKPQTQHSKFEENLPIPANIGHSADAPAAVLEESSQSFATIVEEHGPDIWARQGPSDTPVLAQVNNSSPPKLFNPFEAQASAQRPRLHSQSQPAQAFSDTRAPECDPEVFYTEPPLLRSESVPHLPPASPKSKPARTQRCMRRATTTEVESSLSRLSFAAEAMRSYYSASAGEPQPATPLRPGRFGLTDTRVLTSCSAQQLEQEAREIQEYARLRDTEACTGSAPGVTDDETAGATPQRLDDVNDLYSEFV
mmetsp:Transcript_6606/g.19055  ORF Transcript_6606/g.19055 Transcript_6606/m.19055 type:complete len:290 (-) Transcript_6606:318-1187(-)|eukprot:CAMPEP_0206145840 /NCGR_PEP_ID=MMETSP1473-20131121/28646_1 /ASSEMBLY_ACC=CAM_ASM_001109 /TAXON_ID=1461547 /ORGANISM="Stichococcus sp, Strain RCC1054" /LENGTH=289 /DNA_ID=CAMNT_0053542199 /DNA_START=375 /DNA_END=1244 /DNA_ORIENTATION=+